MRRLPGNEPGAELADRPEQAALDDVARRLGGIAGRPGIDRMREAAAFPPLRVLAGQMQRQLVAAGAPGLADPVGGHEAALVEAGTGAEAEELHMPGIELAPQRPRLGIHRLDQALALAPPGFLQQAHQLLFFPGAQRLEIRGAHAGRLRLGWRLLRRVAALARRLAQKLGKPGIELFVAELLERTGMIEVEPVTIFPRSHF